jgi:hypothetical protein
MTATLAPMTFTRAKLELQLLGRSFEAGAIDIDTWCEGVHEVIVAFQEGADARASYASALPATALPTPADAPQPVTAKVVRAITGSHRVDRHNAPGQPA